MKKSIYMAFVAVLTIVVITSCNNTNPPTDPAKGGTYLIGEVYDIVGLTVEKATTRLEGKGYVQDEDYLNEEDEYYELLFRFNNGKEKYQVAIEVTDNVVEYASGYTDLNFKEYQEWRNYMIKKMSDYNIWFGYINGKEYAEYYHQGYESDAPLAEFDKVYKNYKYTEGDVISESYNNDQQGCGMGIGIEDDIMFCQAFQIVNLERAHVPQALKQKLNRR